MTVSGSILEDLEIDKSDFLTDPESFAQRCFDKAEELKAICKEDKSLASYTASVKERAQELQTPPHIQALIQNLFDEVDKLEPAQIYPVIESVRRLIDDLGFTIKDKLSMELTNQSASVMDKRLAHQLYIRLHKMYQHYVETIKCLMPQTKLPIIRALPGNYGAGLSPLSHLYYYFDDAPDDPYMNHRAVIRKLGLVDEVKDIMGLLEYIENNPNCGVTIKEKVL